MYCTHAIYSIVGIQWDTNGYNLSLQKLCAKGRATAILCTQVGCIAFLQQIKDLLRCCGDLNWNLLKLQINTISLTIYNGQTCLKIEHDTALKFWNPVPKAVSNGQELQSIGLITGRDTRSHRDHYHSLCHRQEAKSWSFNFGGFTHVLIKFAAQDRQVPWWMYQNPWHLANVTPAIHQGMARWFTVNPDRMSIILIYGNMFYIVLYCS